MMTTAKQMGWEVGCDVYLVERGWQGTPKERPARIIAVGRKWVTIQPEGTDGKWAQERFDCETLQLDGGGFSSRGRVYASKSEYMEATERQKEWSTLYRSLSGHVPAHLTLEDVRAIAAMLTPTRAEAGAGEREE